MTDLEITKLCAEAMGYKVVLWCEGEPHQCWLLTPGGRQYYPLHDRAQAMELVEKFHLRCCPREWEIWEVQAMSGQYYEDIEESATSKNLKRAICECAAKMHSKQEVKV